MVKEDFGKLGYYMYEYCNIRDSNLSFGDIFRIDYFGR